MPMMMGIAVCAEPLVELILTAKWLPCVPYMRVFCFTFAFYPVQTANLNAIKALGRSDLFLKLEMIKKVVGLTIILITMRYSVMAMAYGALIGSVLNQIINAWPNRKLLNYSYGQQIKDIMPSIVLSAVMFSAVYCVQFLGLNDWMTLLIQLPAGVLIYVCGSILFKFESFEYLIITEKDFLKRD